MSTFWFKMSGLGLVISNLYEDIDRKIILLWPSVTFLRGCILKLEGLLQGYVKWKNTMTFNVNFLTQIVGTWTCYKQCIWGYWPKNHIFCLSVTFLSLGCIFKLEGLLQGYVKWKNTMTFNVNFLTQIVGIFLTCYKQFVFGDIDRKINDFQCQLSDTNCRALDLL